MKRYPLSVGAVITRLEACQIQRDKFRSCTLTAKQVWDRVYPDQIIWFLRALYKFFEEHMDYTMPINFKRLVNIADNIYDDILVSQSSEYWRLDWSGKVQMKEKIAADAIRARIKFPQKTYDLVEKHFRDNPPRTKQPNGRD